MTTSAKLIKNNGDTKYICNICTEEIENDKIIGLKCNPLKHVFCYDCIFDWYKQLASKKYKYTGNYNMQNMCPICRKGGGLLPISHDKKIKGIHCMVQTPAQSIKICGCKINNETGYCNAIGNDKYGGYCGKHKKMALVDKKSTETTEATENIDNSYIVDPNKLEHKCGAKFRTKSGYCSSVGNPLYGGFCGMHRDHLILVHAGDQKLPTNYKLPDIEILKNMGKETAKTSNKTMKTTKKTNKKIDDEIPTIGLLLSDDEDDDFTII